MEVTDELYKSLLRYFKSLEYVGYKSLYEVNQLLVLMCIEELLTGPMQYYITEEDYKDITKAIASILGTHLIPYKVYKDALVDVNKMFSLYRVLEDNVFKSTEMNKLRN